jgi:hypothetical protein
MRIEYRGNHLRKDLLETTESAARHVSVSLDLRVCRIVGKGWMVLQGVGPDVNEVRRDWRSGRRALNDRVDGAYLFREQADNRVALFPAGTLRVETGEMRPVNGRLLLLVVERVGGDEGLVLGVTAKSLSQ